MSNATAPTALEGRSGHGGRRVLLIVLALVAALALVLVGGTFAFASQYDGKALPGTTVLGQDVSGKSPEEIAGLVTQKAQDVKVSVKAGDQTRQASLADLGVTVDAAATAAKATSHDGDVLETVRSTFDGQRAVDPVVSVDKSTATAFASSLVPDDRTAAADAQVTYDKDAGAWKVVPGRAGQGVDAAALVRTVEQKAPSLTSFSIDQPVQETQPTLGDAAAQKSVDAINAALAQPMSVSGPKGTTYDVSASTRSSWLSVAPNEAHDGFAVTVDRKAVDEWVAAKAKKENVEPTDGLEQVDAAGATVKVVSEKKDGSTVSNADAVAQQLATALAQGSPVQAAFEVKPVAAQVTRAKVATAAQPAAPSASPAATPAATQQAAAQPSAAPSPTATATTPSGEKWIDVNLSDKTVTAYVGENPVWGPVKIVDGKDGKTEVGTYKIYQRHDKQDMTNAWKVSKDSKDYYYTKDVPWVQYFDGGIAFHGAPWRSSFGYSGSHGCINMSVSDAEWLYGWASIGTKVVVHN